MTPAGSTPLTVKVGSGVGLAIGGLAFFATLFNYGFDATRRASVPGYWSNLYDIQARALIDGHLSVPTGSLGIEGIVHDGHTHMYFPIFPALLRLPVLVTTHEFDGRLTLLSMALAWIVFATMTTRMFWLVSRVVNGQDEPTRLHAGLGAVLIAAATGGTTLVFDASQPWVYNEAYVWAVAAALGAMYWMLRVLTDGESMSVRWLAGFVLLSVLTRPTEGWAVGLATIGIAVWVASGRARAVDRRIWWQLLLAGLLPLAVGVIISEIKFDTLYLHPLSEQVWTSVSAHRREALAVNGGSLTGPQFFTTSLLGYFRPDGIRFVDYFPWVTLPAHPVQAQGGAFIDQSYRTGSVTAFMPLLLLLTVSAALALIRPGARREDRVLLPPLVAGVLITGGVMAYGYYAMRYVTDFVPALVFGGCVGTALLLRWTRGRPRLAVGTLAVMSAATLFSVGAHLAVGYTTAVISTAGPQLRGYVARQVALSGGALADRVTRTDQTPTHATSAQTDDLRVVGDCEGLYLNTGDAYRPWTLVAARDLVLSVAATAEVTAGSTPLFATSTGWQGTLQTRSDARARVVLNPPADATGFTTLRGKWRPIVEGVVVRVENISELEFFRVSTADGGQVGGIPATSHDDAFNYSPVGVAPAEDQANDAGVLVRSSWSKAPDVCRKVDRLR